MNASQWSKTVPAWIAGALAGTAALALVTAALRWLAEGISPAQVIVAEAIRLAFPVVGALLLARWARRTSFTTFLDRFSLSRLKVTIVVLLVLLYLATWAFGVPAVTTHLVTRDIAAYKRALAARNAPWSEHYPQVRSAFAVPLLPGIVLVYYESQLGGLWGSGSWYLFAWWGTHERELVSSWRWVS